MLLAAEAHRPAYDDLATALAQGPNDVEALDGLSRAAAAVGRLSDAETLLRRLASEPVQ